MASSGEDSVRHWIMLITEQRRFPQMGYKSDSTVISGNEGSILLTTIIHIFSIS